VEVPLDGIDDGVHPWTPSPARRQLSGNKEVVRNRVNLVILISCGFVICDLSSYSMPLESVLWRVLSLFLSRTQRAAVRIHWPTDARLFFDGCDG
jgi:hypothetical protein